MATIQEINSLIMFGDFNNEQLTSIIDAIKFRRAQMTRDAKRSFTVGSDVKFFSTKRGITVSGRVTKVAIKYITVSTAQGLWRVPANMLEAA